MATYHIEVESDDVAQEVAAELGERAYVSFSHGNGPAVVVLTLPEGVDVSSVTSRPAVRADAPEVTQEVREVPVFAEETPDETD